MSAQQFSAGKYSRQNAPKEREEGSFNTRVSVTEGTTPQSRSRLVQGFSVGNIHRNSVEVYVPHDLNHAPYESAKRRNAPQTSLTPDGDSVDLGLVTAKQHKQLSDRSRKGKKNVD